MYKKYLLFLVMIAVSFGALWAAGGRDKNVSRTAEDPSGFTDTIDISEKKPGRYNYYLEARDRAGNIAISGPENINIDPVSDLPGVTIINPIPFMRVQGNLNIVGIAFDDDAVGQVEFTIHRGIDGRGEEVLRTVAEGTDYWSYFLDTTDPEIWTDGNYTITAWATDINGLSGISEEFRERDHKKAQVFWRLDRKNPETIVTSHEVGALVAGNVRLRGTVYDGNGIRSFRYSLDEGNRYIPANVRLDRRTGLHEWDITINTARNFEDGPAVIWFQAEDGNGSVGTAAHLLFVNNTGPDVKIVYPEANSIVNGILSVSGFAQHPVGMKSVTWRAGNIVSGEFELLPGNDWYSTQIDLRGQRPGNIDVEFRAEDVSGNVTVARQRYRLDINADLPIVTLTEPVPGVIDGNRSLVVKGNVRDDDGIEAIFYSLNSGVPVEIPASGEYFQFLIHDIPEGNNNLEVWARDNSGLTGPRAQVRGIVVPNKPAEPGITSFTWGRSSPVNFFTGMTISPVPILNPRTGIQTGVEPISMQIAYRMAAAPVSASVQIGEQAAVPVRLAGSRDMFTASVPFPAGLSDGLTRIRLTAVDRNGQESVFDEFVFVNNQETRTVYDYVEDEFGEVIPVERQAPAPLEFMFTWVRQNVLGDGRFLFTDQEETIIGISSVPLRSAVLVGDTGLLDVQIDENGRVILSAARAGVSGNVNLRLETVDGREHQTAPFMVLADFTGPVITLQDMTDYNWVRTTVPVSFNVSSTNRVNSIDYSLNMGETWESFYTPAQITALGSIVNTNISRNLELAEVEDGSIQILFRAVSESRRTTYADFSVLKDTQAPAALLTMPIEDARVNGTIRMSFVVEEFGSLQSVVYNRPARTGTPAITKEIFNADTCEKDYSERFFEVLMDSAEMPLDEYMNFTFTDKAGNYSVLNSWTFVIDQEMDIPKVYIILPLDNEVITTDFIVSGIMFDDDAISHIQWRIDDDPWQTLEAANGFSIPVSLSTLTDNDHTVTVIAEDIYGVRSDPVTRDFRVSLSEPAAAITYPLFDTVLRDEIEITGTAFDRNGIKEIQVSLDNGNTFNTVMGTFGTSEETIQWSYKFNTIILEDGPHVVFIRVWDRYDIPATYANMINIDNTPPEIILDSPGDGSSTTGVINVMGRILDPNLSGINIQLRSLDGVTIQPALRERRVEPGTIIREGLDLTGQADGHYNIAVIATDKAGNITRVSRNFEIARQTLTNFVEILYPLENEVVSGNLNLYGFAGGADIPDTVTLRVNGRDLLINEVDATGYFRFALDNEILAEGENSVIVHSNFGGTTQTASRAYNINYRAAGPWITIDTFSFGDFAYDRPYLEGRAGYILTEEDEELLADRNTDSLTRNAIRDKRLNYTEISFDNGRTFTRTSSSTARNVDFRYRLETGEMTEGLHYIVVRATMRNGETAITRMKVQVDKTPPVIRLISPEAGGVYNQEIAFSATATDDIELVSMTYHLRVGDKAFYAVPGFLQGLYIESTIPPFVRQINNKAPVVPFGGGATYMDIGLGLSFFDDNVKIQAQYGFLTPDLYNALGGEGDIRYGGHVLGIKLLASVYSLPFGSFMGPDFDWLSATFAVGANFSLFDVAQQGYTQSGRSTWMSALLLQIEFPRVTLARRTNLRTFSLFTEGQLWFVPTDVDAEKNNVETILPKILIGLRLYIF